RSAGAARRSHRTARRWPPPARRRVPSRHARLRPPGPGPAAGSAPRTPARARTCPTGRRATPGARSSPRTGRCRRHTAREEPTGRPDASGHRRQGPVSPRERPSQRERVHQPAEHVRAEHERAEEGGSEPHLLAHVVAQQHGENRRDEEGEEQQHAEMRPHDHPFRPAAMSKASNATSRFNRPATMRKVLPYSYVTAMTSPPPAASTRATRYGRPMPRSAIAASATSG